MDGHDLNMAIAQQLKAITGDAGAFVASVLSDDISRDDQIVFALRLVRLAEHIKERADNTIVMVVEGSVVDDCDSRALSGGADRRAGDPRTAEHE